MKQYGVYIGWEPREVAAYAVARDSIRSRARLLPQFDIRPVYLDVLRKQGLYDRPHTTRMGPDLKPVMWDSISNAPMATEFACSRFLVPELERPYQGMRGRGRWALFMDCDMMIRRDLGDLFELCEANNDKAVMVVKHNHNPSNTVKMDGQEQTRYSRKNWSSVCAFNVQHPSNEALTAGLVNGVPGRELHAFCWLRDKEIGELPPEWNYLVGHTKGVDNPAIVHFTDGIPLMAGYEHCEFAEEWKECLREFAFDPA